MATKKRIIVGLSGGVDSAVAAWLLKKAGHEVIAIFMKSWEDDDEGDYCATREDFMAALACAEVLGIELHHINCAKIYQERVFSYFLAELQSGRTPNPDILCNNEVKFHAFLKHCHTLSADAIATGHYAQKLRSSSKTSANGYTNHLLEAVDVRKDQTYFLHRLLPHQLDVVLFPLGHWSKSHVRNIAREANIPSADRKDSTGICFIGERPFRNFLQQYLPIQPGEMVDEEGHILGQHQGLPFYTLGQRKGLNIGGVRGAKTAPWFVIDKVMATNRLIVGQGHDHSKLYQRFVHTESPYWLPGIENIAPVLGKRLLGKVRHQQTSSACVIHTVSETHLTVKFEKPLWAVTPGQSLVLYHHGECIGGAIIRAATS